MSATVWDVDLAVASAHHAACIGLLNAEETARASRFVREADRIRYVTSHAALRFVLGRHLGVDPRALAFATEAAGKPHLAGPWAGACRFNLSHSGERALIGLCPDREIGVDVEEMRPIPDLLRLARAHFAQEEIAALAALSPDALPAAFYACWTCKEAVAKATGRGLSLPLEGFAVSVPPRKAGVLRAPAGTGAWSLHVLPTAPGYAAAAAVPAPDTPCLRIPLPPDWAKSLPPAAQQGR